MRFQKFRAWHTKLKKWIAPEIVSIDGFGIIDIDGAETLDIELDFNVEYKDFFQNDIVTDGNITGVVIYHNGTYCVKIHKIKDTSNYQINCLPYIDAENFEKIGNIRDNSYLLS